MAKRKKYGKTAKQWDVLYNRFKSELKYEKIEKYTKTEFKEIWKNRKKGETVTDIVQNLRKDKYLQYELKYKHESEKGFGLTKKLTKDAFQENMKLYNNSLRDVFEYQRTTSKKQAKKIVDYLDRLGKEDYEAFKDIKVKDFLYDDIFDDENKISKKRKAYVEKRLDLVQKYKDFLEENNLWHEVYSYGG